MKTKLRKNKKKFNFYEFQVRHNFVDFESIFDLVTPSRYSDWEFKGLNEAEKTFVYRDKRKGNLRYLDEMAVYHYISLIRIDDILANDMCLRLKNEPTKGELKYV